MELVFCQDVIKPFLQSECEMSSELVISYGGRAAFGR